MGGENGAKQDIAQSWAVHRESQSREALVVQGCCSGLAGVAGECPAVTAALGSAI